MSRLRVLIATRGEELVITAKVVLNPEAVTRGFWVSGAALLIESNGSSIIELSLNPVIQRRNVSLSALHSPVALRLPSPRGTGSRRRRSSH